QAKLFPGLVQDHQPAEIPGFAQLQRLCSHKAASLKGLADELAGLRGQRRDIADGAGARALWGTKGLANQVGEVGDAAVLAFGDLHEHTCYIEAHIFINASQILTNLDLLLATFLMEILVSQRFSHFEREVRLSIGKMEQVCCTRGCPNESRHSHGMDHLPPSAGVNTAS